MQAEISLYHHASIPFHSIMLRRNNLVDLKNLNPYCALQHKRVRMNHVSDSKSMKAGSKVAPGAAILADPAPVATKAAPVAKAVPVAKTATAVAAPLAAAPAPVTIPEVLPTPAAPVAAAQKDVPMNDTVTQFAEETKARTESAISEFQNRAKAVVEKSQAGFGEAVEFNKGNVEAVVASAKVAAKGAQEIAAYSVEYGKGAIEKAVADTRRLYSVKSPTEFFSLQSEIAKSTMDEAVAQASKFTENYLKLVGEMVQPLSNRYALAAEKVKTAVAA
jgi:phasin family protein